MVKRVLYWLILLGCVLGRIVFASDSDYYFVEDVLLGTSMHNSRDAEWRPGEGIALEVTGLAPWGEGRLAVATRKGDVWLLEGTEGPVEGIRYRRFASGLDEPLGLMRSDEHLYVAQRSEITRLADTDGDGVADDFRVAGKGWHVSGAYHGYAYGPVEDGQGRLWATLNLDMGPKSNNAAPWRGWGVCLQPDGTVKPMCAGMRSPFGLGRNAHGDVFFTDQQGNWVPTNSLHHLREGAYYGNPDGMAPAARDDSPVKPLTGPVDGLPYPEAVEKIPQLAPPAIWFPYNKMGRSRTGITLENSGGTFGPFEGQLLIGEFTLSRVGRVTLEQVDGVYQGACYPFLKGFPSAVLQTALGADGRSLFVGMSNRGWSSLGSAAYGLQRVRWTGKTPFEVREMKVRRDGFELQFTRAADAATAGDASSYQLIRYTYPLHARYGGEEILKESLRVTQARLATDGRSVRLTCEGLRPYFVHELHYGALRCAAEGKPPWHDRAYYTINRLPSGSTSAASSPTE